VFLIGGISNVVLVGPIRRSSREGRHRAGQGEAGHAHLRFGGQGTSQHLSGETFKLLAGVEMTHVPYKGSAPRSRT
jgi:hypothetical protein